MPTFDYSGGSFPGDIRSTRPELFQKGAYSNEFAMPQGMEPFDPGADPWHEQQPELWDTIVENLKGKLEAQPQPIYLPPKPEGGSEEEIRDWKQELNRIRQSWMQPSGLQAVEMGEYRKSEAAEKKIDRAERRIAGLEKTMIQANKGEAPQSVLAGLENRYNKAIDDYEKLVGADTGFTKYTGEGKLKLDQPEKPGMLRRAAGAVGDVASEAARAVAQGFRTEDVTEPVPEAGMQFEGRPEITSPIPVIKEALKSLDRAFVNAYGNKAAQKIEEIKKETTEPTARIEKALDQLPDSPEKDVIKQQLNVMTPWKMTPQRKAAQREAPEMLTTPRFDRDALKTYRAYMRMIGARQAYREPAR